MRTPLLAVVLLIAPLASQSIAMTQEAPKNDAPEAAKAAKAEQHFYHLNFIVQELDVNGKPVNGRSYFTIIGTESRTNVRIRTSSRVPVPIASSTVSTNLGMPTQFQYLNVSVNFDVRNAHEVGRQLALDVGAEVNSLAPTSSPNIHEQVVRNNQWDAPVLIPIGKATPIFTSDSLDSKGSMQVVVTATPLQ